MDDKLISVISIKYDVEPYLKECLESLSSLKYPELEIILVVGGKEEKTPDGESRIDYKGCLELAESYAEKDSRFRVITCVASGAGDARNRGLRAAKGAYIGFVDGDDFVEPDIYDRLFENISKNNGDISICGHYREYTDHREIYDRAAGEGARVLSRREAVRTLLKGDSFFFHSWDKLFKAECFEGIKYPEDLYLEDRYTIGDIFLKADRIVYDAAPLYHFRIRSDSLSRIKNMSELNTDADTCFASEVLEQFPDLENDVEACLLYGHITCIQNALVNGNFDRKEEEKHFDYIREHEKSSGANPLVGKNTRIKAFLSLRCLPLLKLITLFGKQKQKKYQSFEKESKT